MKNKNYIKSIFADFKANDLEQAQAKLERLKRNFEIDDDEYIFNLTAKTYQPYKQLAEDLINEGKANYVYNNITNTDSFDISEWKLKIRIEATSSNSLASIRIGDGGKIEAVTRSGKQDMQHIKKTVKNWLKSEFGSIEA